MRDRSSDTGGLVESAERTAFQTPCELRRALALFRHDIDHATDGVRPIQTALRTAKHFNPLDVRSEDLAKIEYAILARVVRIDSVDNHLGVIRVATAHEDRGLAPGTSCLDDVQT